MMNYGTNDILSQGGLYTVLVNLVNDYTVGEHTHWKGKYGYVIRELNTEFEQFRKNRGVIGKEDTIQAKLCRTIGYSTRKKIACIVHLYGVSVNNHEKTVSIHDNFKKYGVVGIHRVAFDNLVFKVKQMIKVKDYKMYQYKSNNHSSFEFCITPKLMRHIHDYQHTEYECYINHDISKVWPSKMAWGNREIQQSKRKLGKELESIRKNKQMWIHIEGQQTQNQFYDNFKLANNIKISHVNDKSVRVSVNTFDGKPVEVTKKIGQDKKTDRLYICHPVLKKRRLYADEKFISYPPKLFTLYKNII